MNKLLIIEDKDNGRDIVLILNKGEQNEISFDLKFDGIKEYAKHVLLKIIEESRFDYEIETEDKQLDLYKETIIKITDSIINDEELQKLFIEKSENPPSD